MSRPGNYSRTVLNGILWVTRIGAPWRDLPERYGYWKTVSNRFYRWRQAGVWDRILHELRHQADAEAQDSARERRTFDLVDQARRLLKQRRAEQSANP